MPPKTKFDRETIVEAAFEVAREKGLSGITARSVSRRLNSSVAPIYVNFDAIEDLEEAVVKKFFALSEEFLAQQEGADLYRRIGLASLAFAREYPVLYRELSIQPNKYLASYETVETAMVEALADDEAMEGWSLEERKRLFLKMRVFQMGLTAMVANGHVPAWMDDRDLEEFFLEVGDDLLRMEQIKRKEQGK